MGILAGLGKEWGKAKDLAKFAFKEATKKKSQGKIGDVMDKSIVPLYPIVFPKKDLSPNLEKLDKAKPGSNDVAKLKKLIEEASKTYRKVIDKEKTKLDKWDPLICKILYSPLDKIDKAVKNIL